MNPCNRNGVVDEVAHDCYRILSQSFLGGNRT